MARDEQFSKVMRKWGAYKIITIGERFKVKTLEIEPGKAIALQSHNQRSEHWVIVKGKAKIRKDEEIFHLNENESIFIPKQIKHRVENPTDKLLKIIEVQCGDYIEEDDITRFEKYLQ